MSNKEIFNAEQRVREMNRMTRQYIHQGGNYMDNRQAPPRFEAAVKPSPAPEHASSPPLRNEPRRMQPSIDNEKLLIILIMYLLIKEKTDIKLIAALGYLLL